jgi:hypothetical protein
MTRIVAPPMRDRAVLWDNVAGMVGDANLASADVFRDLTAHNLEQIPT